MSMESATAALANTPEQQSDHTHNPLTEITLETRITDHDANTRSNPVPLRGNDKSERFAHDINAKINALETQIGHTASLLERSQEFVKSALEELRDRIMGVRHEAETNHLRSQQELAVHRQHLDQHTSALDQQKTTLNTLGDQVTTQAEDLHRHHTHLTAQDTQIGALDQRQIELKQMLQGLSQEHDVTTSKMNLLADQLFEASQQIQAHEHRHAQARKLIIGLFGVSAISVAGFSYFLFNPIAAPDAMNAQVAELSGAMADQRATTANISGELQRIGTGLTILEGDVRAIHESQGLLVSEQNIQRDALQGLLTRINQFDTSIGDLRIRLQRLLGSRAPLEVPVLPLHDRQWLTSRPAEHFVIQLMGAREYDTIVRFINRNASTLKPQPLSMNVVTHEGQPWHNLMAGDFSSLQEARLALDALPPELRVAQPWIRPVKSIVNPQR